MSVRSDVQTLKFKSPNEHKLENNLNLIELSCSPTFLPHDDFFHVLSLLVHFVRKKMRYYCVQPSVCWLAGCNHFCGMSVRLCVPKINFFKNVRFKMSVYAQIICQPKCTYVVRALLPTSSTFFTDKAIISVRFEEKNNFIFFRQIKNKGWNDIARFH